MQKKNMKLLQKINSIEKLVTRSDDNIFILWDKMQRKDINFITQRNLD